jgi:carboxypeptidase family protein/TonB-dependent receptor-like protein
MDANVARALFGVLALAVASGGSGAPARAQSAAPARVTGVVFDSLGDRPLAGATVQLLASPPGHGAYSAVADSIGRFRFDSVSAGTYIAGILDPLLDSIGVNAPYQKLTVASGASLRIALAIPSERSLARAICRDSSAGKGADSTGFLVGHVRDASTGAPIRGSAVTLDWQALIFGTGGPHAEPRSARATSSDEGWFAICGLHPGDYRLHAELTTRTTGTIEFALQPQELSRITLLLGADPNAPVADSASTGGATISGHVTTSSGSPVEGAQIIVDGSSLQATTDAGGAFVLGGLPDGTRMAEARALGFQPVRMRVEPTRGDPKTVTIVMRTRIETLGTVRVVGKNRKPPDPLAGFAARRQKGEGRFMTKEEIEARNVQNACDLLRRVPGVHVMEEGNGGCRANIRGATTGTAQVGTKAAPHLCEPTIYQDNIVFGGSLSEFVRLVTPRDIVGIEVYTSSTEPPQFSGQCGVIVVWTRTTQ